MKGLPPSDHLHIAVDCGDDDDYQDTYEMASNDHRLTGIEKNPGPVSTTVVVSKASRRGGHPIVEEIESEDEDKPPDLLFRKEPLLRCESSQCFSVPQVLNQHSRSLMNYLQPKSCGAQVRSVFRRNTVV